MGLPTQQAGMLFVAAAGNSALNTDVSVSYPAGYNLPSVISVGLSICRAHYNSGITHSVKRPAYLRVVHVLSVYHHDAIIIHS